jgi:hypothetical protein
MASIETPTNSVPPTTVSSALTVHAIQTGTVAVKTRQREAAGQGPAVERSLISACAGVLAQLIVGLDARWRWQAWGVPERARALPSD